MSYKKFITKKKGIKGGLQGSIVAFLTIVIVGFLKRYVMDMETGTENLISALLATIISGALLALTEAIRNWLKHKDDIDSDINVPKPRPEPDKQEKTEPEMKDKPESEKKESDSESIQNEQDGTEESADGD